MGYSFQRRSRRPGQGCAPRLLIGVIFALFALGSYYFGTEKFENPVTGRSQRVALSPKEEIALGLNSAPEMQRQFGGLHRDAALQQKVSAIGQRLVQASSEVSESPYYYQFHLLADDETVNAFALPGGQIFITYGLLRLLQTDDEIAAVLAHEIVHVAGRHSNEQMAKAQLSQNLVGAVVMAGGDDYGATAGQVAQFVSRLTNTSYGREDELESDRLGVRLMKRAGYNPEAMITVMKVLEKAAGGTSPPEFLSTHPNPGNRIERIKEEIARVNGQ